MNETSGTDTPLMEQDAIKKLFAILKDNGKDADGLLNILGHVTAMENQLNAAVNELQTMRRDMAEMRDHPMRTACQAVAKDMESKISQLREQLNNIKEKLVEGCKRALESFKANGVIALNGVAKFFRIKPMFESLRQSMQNDIKLAENNIAKIDTMAKRYHGAGLHLRNVGRVLRGKEALTEIKPNGKLAKLISAPARADRKCCKGILGQAEKAIVALERLEKAAERGAEKPSTLDTMKTLQKQINEERLLLPPPTKVKVKGAEI